MKTNAEKIAAWRSANPGVLLTVATIKEVCGLADLSDLTVATIKEVCGLADLSDLSDADLWGGMPISTPSGDGYLIPTPDGWRITIGCWRDHTLDDLRALIADKTEWPEATGAERERRRPILAAVLTLAEAHAAYHSTLIPELAEKWGTKVEGANL